MSDVLKFVFIILCSLYLVFAVFLVTLERVSF